MNIIAPERIELVKSLLALGTPRREIIAQTGVSKQTISLIASGRHKYKRAPPPKTLGPAPNFPPTGPIGRCPNCGGRVYLPCRKCALVASGQPPVAS